MTVRIAQILLTFLSFGFVALFIGVLLELIDRWAMFGNDIFGFFGMALGYLAQLAILIRIWKKTVKWSRFRLAATYCAPLIGVSISCLPILFASGILEFESILLVVLFLPFLLQPAVLIIVWTDWSADGFRANERKLDHMLPSPPP